MIDKEAGISANVLSISSHVAYGHVGNSAAVFALQRLGHEVWPVPTVLYSNHPGHGAFRGPKVTAEALAEILAGLGERDLFRSLDAVLTGYLCDTAQARVTAEAVREVRAARPGVLYCCDPVLGDREKGLYVPEAVAEKIKARLVGEADIVTPNPFELEFLSGQRVASIDAALAAAETVRSRGPGLVICTSLSGEDEAPGTLATCALGDGGAWLVRTPVLEGVPHGAGDLLAALFLGRYLAEARVDAALSHAVSATFAILRASVAAGADELALIAAQDQIVAPETMFPATRIR